MAKLLVAICGRQMLSDVEYFLQVKKHIFLPFLLMCLQDLDLNLLRRSRHTVADRGAVLVSCPRLCPSKSLLVTGRWVS